MILVVVFFEFCLDDCRHVAAELLLLLLLQFSGPADRHQQALQAEERGLGADCVTLYFLAHFERA